MHTAYVTAYVTASSTGHLLKIEDWPHPGLDRRLTADRLLLGQILALCRRISTARTVV